MVPPMGKCLSSGDADTLSDTSMPTTSSGVPRTAAMGVQDLAESLGKLQLEAPLVLRSDHGEVYTVDRNTGETVIKGSRRKDGTVRSDIKVKPGYTPPEERAVYVPRFKREPHIAIPADIADETAVTRAKDRGDGGREELPWRSAPTSSGGTATTREGRPSRTKPRPASKPGDGEGPPTESVPETQNATNVDIGIAVKKLKKAIRTTRQKLREAEARKKKAEKDNSSNPHVMIQRMEVLSEKVKRLESALAELTVTITASASPTTKDT